MNNFARNFLARVRIFCNSVIRVRYSEKLKL